MKALVYCSIFGLGLFSGFLVHAQSLDPANQFFLDRFVDELPLLARIKIPNTPGQAVDITVTLAQSKLQMHMAVPDTPVFAYNGSVPGPIIEVEKGQTLRVHWKNDLPKVHILAAPTGGMNPGLPDVKAVTHLHGAVVKQDSTSDRLHNNDGWPDLFTLSGEEQVAEYPNNQDARILWYHDHAMGDTGRNVAAGLVGMYLIHDDYERSLNLPSGDYDIPIIFQTHGFNGDGTRYYTKNLAQEFYGNSATINGKLWPYLNVEPRKYRLRFLNAANARSFALRLADLKTDAPGPAFYQIATDGGFLQETVMLNDPGVDKPPRLVLAPAERADVIVDFSKYVGQTLLLQNNSLDAGDAEIPLPQLMVFKVVKALVNPDTSQLPMHMRKIPLLAEHDVSVTRPIVFDQFEMQGMSPMLLLNGKMWHDPVEEKPLLNSTEIWQLVNLQPDTHPFHIHLVNFQVLDRIPFDLDAYRKTGKIVATGPTEMADANEAGWKDVVRVVPGMVTRIIMNFGPYAGHYVYHCHILEHEDMDMMRPYDVVAP
jgi:spore coat protein A